MNIEEYREYCLSLPCVEETLPFDDVTLVYKIGGKVFKGQEIFVGIDVHLKSWSIEVVSQHQVLKKFRQNPEPEALHKFLTTTYP